MFTFHVHDGQLLVRGLVKLPGKARLNGLSNSRKEFHQTMYQKPSAIRNMPLQISMVVLKLILMNMISNGAGAVLKNENQSCDTLLVGAFFGGKFWEIIIN